MALEVGKKLIAKAWRRLFRTIRNAGNIFRPKRGVLVYIGAHRGTSLGSLFRRYRTCYAFEPNPQLFRSLQERFGRHPNVRLINAAVAERDGEVQLNVSSNDGASSSLGHFDKNFEAYKDGNIKVVGQITVQSVNLMNFLRAEGVDQIDDYVSDIQGMDLTVLKTLKPMISARKIGTITCEVAKDARQNIYADLPDNSESGFAALLSNDYELVATGWGSSLEDNYSEEIPEEWWEMDCKWRAKT
jgi:FkbM family methyltransferase